MNKTPPSTKILFIFIIFQLCLSIIGNISIYNFEKIAVCAEETIIKEETKIEKLNKDDSDITIEKVTELKNNVLSNENQDVINDYASTETIEQNTDKSENKKFKIGEECDIPSISTSVKLFTDYRAYNLKYTPHYRLQQVSVTDSQGLRRFGEDYIVAMGSYYSVSIGDRFEITLDTGNCFTVILGDGKWDSDCDERYMYMPVIDYNGNNVGNLLEFIIDKDIIDESIYQYGDLNKLNNLNGNITKIVYLGRDDSADWDTYITK